MHVHNLSQLSHVYNDIGHLLSHRHGAGPTIPQEGLKRLWGNIFLVPLTFLSADRVANCESELTVPEKIFKENSVIYYHEVEVGKSEANLRVSHLTTPPSGLQKQKKLRMIYYMLQCKGCQHKSL